MVYKTLNNKIARRIIRHAIEHDYRACAYSLFNLYRDELFASEPYRRLFDIVADLLGSQFDEMLRDRSIGFDVRWFISSYSKKFPII